jgi:hypothetical protein
MRHNLQGLASTALLGLVLGCGNRGEAGETNTSPGLTTALTTADSDTDSSGTGSDDGDVIFDFGNGGTGMNTGGDNMNDGCKKVDLLFVIDDSGSMADEQINLVNSFPSFINSIQTELADTKGYHVGVITSDPYLYNETGCNTLGSLVTQTGGVDSSNAVCSPYASGYRWMNETDDLTTKFQCAAQVGTGGSGNEQPMEALGWAISDSYNAAGGCNEGFLRDDALLVVVIITDEEDDHEVEACLQNPQTGSAGEPMNWYDAVVGVKSGLETNVVVLSLVGPTGNNACPALDKCVGGIDGAEVATRIVQFTEMFTYGFIGQVCAPDYGPFFQSAVGVIKSACDDFTPPG